MSNIALALSNGWRCAAVVEADTDRVLAPHHLMMSATPIPRSLAMSYYADLDVSVIDELPGGRQPITTKLVSEQRRAEIVGRIHDAITRRSQCLLGVSADRGEREAGVAGHRVAERHGAARRADRCHARCACGAVARTHEGRRKAPSWRTSPPIAFKCWWRPR